jgi:hypothetical protein
MRKSNKQQVKKEKCPHKNQVLRTIGGHCTVQVTAIFCKDCGKQLTEAKVEV